jgi:hypothetical protein
MRVSGRGCAFLARLESSQLRERRATPNYQLRIYKLHPGNEAHFHDRFRALKRPTRPAHNESPGMVPKSA